MMAGIVIFVTEGQDKVVSNHKDHIPFSHHWGERREENEQTEDEVEEHSELSLHCFGVHNLCKAYSRYGASGHRFLRIMCIAAIPGSDYTEHQRVGLSFPSGRFFVGWSADG